MDAVGPGGAGRASCSSELCFLLRVTAAPASVLTRNYCKDRGECLRVVLPEALGPATGLAFPAADLRLFPFPMALIYLGKMGCRLFPSNLTFRMTCNKVLCKLTIVFGIVLQNLTRSNTNFRY